MAPRALQKYNEKRNFSLTPEPPGKTEDKRRTKKENLTFTVQKHDATRLHYDFRLEWNGVLWSWAVPKGPSYNPKDKRLAVRTEDHPLSYSDFEGIIPENQYGAGPVMLWDTGTWTPLDGDPEEAMRKGKITFRLDGAKLQGDWTLARMRAKDNKRENWLLIKSRDDKATDKEDDNFLNETDYSVKTGRDFKEIARAEASGVANKTTSKSSKKADFTNLEKKYKAPQLATLVDQPPAGKDWIHEVKYDGYRLLIFSIDGAVRIRTRNGHDWTDKFPLLRDAVAGLEAGSFVIDGEAVVIDEQGLSNFKKLQNSLGETGARMQGFFFDLLYWNGTDYANRPFAERREALEQLFKTLPQGPLYLSEIIEGRADDIINKACDLGLEGIISKNKNARYIQKRAKSWLKSKCEKRQEFIICGFVPATDRPKAVGSLHLGLYKDGKLAYAGKVGTGFNAESARALYQKLHKLRIDKPPFDIKPPGRHGQTIWVRPETLCEVKFGMWTQTGKIRHASFQGLREDKAPQQITREEPEPLRKAEKEMTQEKAKTADKSTRTAKQAVINGVTISHPDREIFPDAHITKSDLAEFYSTMADQIMPGITRRPISVVRCPGGIDKQCFFQRSKGKGMPEHIYTVDINHDGKDHDYIYIEEIRGLIGLVQMGSIEIHPWGVRIDKPEKPDRLIFDLDPAEDVPFEAVRLAAQDVHNRLEMQGLQSFLRTTGGKGLHIVIPITRQHEWDTVKTFARNFARRMVDETPSVYTVNMAKKKRHGRIFVDYLRNDFAATAVMDYCVRARKGAPVAVPLSWDELEDLESANQFSIRDVLKRKQQKRLFSYPAIKQGLTKTILTHFAD